MQETSEKEILKQRRKRIFSLRSLILLILCASIVAFLFSIFDTETLGKIVTDTNPWLLLAAALCYLGSNFFKTIRFLIFFNEKKISISKMFTVVSYHNFFNQIMPARTGELTLVYYLRTILKIDMSRSVHSLLVVRFMDLVIVASFFILSFILTASESVSPALLAAAVIIGIASLAVILLIDRFVKLSAHIFDGFCGITKLNSVSITQKISSKLHELSDTFSKESVVHKIPALVAISIVVWLVLYTFSFCVIRAFPTDINFLESMLGATAHILTNVLPINSFGSFGTMEAGWVGGYMLVGIEKNVAIISAFTYHLVNFVSAGFIALVCMVVYKVTVSKEIGKKENPKA